MTSPRTALADALRAAGLSAAGAVAHHAGVTARQAANAIGERAVATIPFLRICAAIRHDPTPDLPHPFPMPSDFDFGLFSLAFRMRRYLNGHSDRQAAQAIGVSPATVCRIERGDAMFIGVVIRACRYVAVSPFGYFRTVAGKRLVDQGVSVPVKRETSQPRVDLPGASDAKAPS